MTYIIYPYRSATGNCLWYLCSRNDRIFRGRKLPKIDLEIERYRMPDNALNDRRIKIGVQQYVQRAQVVRCDWKPLRNIITLIVVVARYNYDAVYELREWWWLAVAAKCIASCFFLSLSDVRRAQRSNTSAVFVYARRTEGVTVNNTYALNVYVIALLNVSENTSSAPSACTQNSNHKNALLYTGLEAGWTLGDPVSLTLAALKKRSF
jgi:hypothetical protein